MSADREDWDGKARSDFMTAFRRWERSDGDDEEGQMLQAAVFVLQGIHRRCADEAEERAMAVIIRAVGDTLSGTVWPSLRPKEGRSFTRDERSAIEFAVSYIVYVDAGIFDSPDGDPRETISRVYGVSLKTVRRWLTSAKNSGYIITIELPTFDGMKQDDINIRKSSMATNLYFGLMIYRKYIAHGRRTLRSPPSVQHDRRC